MSEQQDKSEPSGASAGSVVEPPIANHYDGRMWVEADRYTELLAKYATLAAETRWIPVTERLPEKPCKVLACGFQKHPVVCSFGWIAPLGHDIPEFRDGGPVRGVTHWMPLPAPPGGGK